MDLLESLKPVLDRQSLQHLLLTRSFDALQDGAGASESQIQRRGFSSAVTHFPDTSGTIYTACHENSRLDAAMSWRQCRAVGCNTGWLDQLSSIRLGDRRWDGCTGR